jgi:SAM-dependent methyltransferase
VELLLDDIHIHESSYVDPNGFVFLYKDQIHRGIHREQESFYRRLFEDGTIAKLSREHHLVESNPADLTLPDLDCPLVLRHQEIKPLTYCVEWCPSMLRQAAKATLELTLALEENNCLLQDAYPWNILFESTRPVHVDFTSIVPLSGVKLLWPAYQQFLNFFLHPLKLSAMGKGQVARLLLRDYINGISLGQLNQHTTMAYALKHPFSSGLGLLMGLADKRAQKTQEWKIKLQKRIDSQKATDMNNPLRRRLLKGLLKQTEAIRFPSSADNWSSYYEELQGALPNKKENVVQRILQQLSPRTVLDLGCNVGRYSIIAARQNATVLAMDASESCIEALFQKASSENLGITPVIGDILNPTPAFGFLAKQFPSMIDRFQSEVVLCLAVMHHLHINGRQPFDRIAKLMNALATKAVIFEYVDPADDNIRLLDHGREINYSLESVSQELSKYFQLTCLDSDRPTRKILVCQKT